MATDSFSISSKPVGAAGSKTPIQTDWVEAIRQQVASLRFGVVQIVIHEGRVVQIDRTEKIRVESQN